MVDGRYSPPTLPRSRTMDVSNGVPVHPAKEKPPINVVGDVGGRIAIMVVSHFCYERKVTVLELTSCILFFHLLANFKIILLSG